MDSNWLNLMKLLKMIVILIIDRNSVSHEEQIAIFNTFLHRSSS